MKLKSYLTFNGQAEEALMFYAGVFGGTVNICVRYGEYAEINAPDDYKEKIVHAELLFGGCEINAADTLPGTKADFGTIGHTLTIFCDTEAQIKDFYNKLAESGKISCELQTTGFAKFYAEIYDRFGVLWALIIE